MDVKIGQYLQAKREDRSTTLKMLHEQSGLRMDVILKIESNDFESLPSPEHAKFLVLQYAEALDINGQRLIEEHADEFPNDDEKSSYIAETENADQKYFKRVVITFIGMIAVLFIVWIILLQIGSQADIFEPRPMYSAFGFEVYALGEAKL